MKDTFSHIRSFVRREGRMTDSQRHAIKLYWDQYGIEFSSVKLDLDRVFQRSAPRVLDIGTGMGDTTVTIARNHPENDYLAVEVHRPGIGSLLRQVSENHLTNIRISNHDVIDVLQQQLPFRSLDMVYIFFPDPWPKKRHHKRRIINGAFLELLKPCLKSYARLYIATDWQDYAEHILEVFAGDNEFINLAGAGNYSPRPVWRPLTRFEKRGTRMDHNVRDFAFTFRKNNYNTSLKS